MCMLLILKNVIILAVLRVLIFSLIKKKTLYNEKDNPHSTFVVIYLIKKNAGKNAVFHKRLHQVVVIH